MLDTVAGSQVELFLANSAASDNLGAALAAAFPKSSGVSTVVHLHGELGAGKTTCVRSLLRSLGVAGLIRSPTYTLVEIYDLTELRYVHVDLYRLQSPRDVEELDLFGYLATSSLLLIEWAEKGGAQVPPPDVAVTLAYAHEGRKATLKSDSEIGNRWLEILKNALT